MNSNHRKNLRSNPKKPSNASVLASRMDKLEKETLKNSMYLEGGSKLVYPALRYPGAYVSSALPIHTNPWLILGNPLRPLSAVNLSYIMECAMRGEFTQIQWLMIHAELRDPDLIALESYRTGSLLEMDWDIKISEKAKRLNMEDEAKLQQGLLVDRYEKIKNLYEAIKHLGLAVFRGYAHVVIRDTELEPLEQLWFVREGLYGPWFWNPESRLVNSMYYDRAEALDESYFLIRTKQQSVMYWAVMKYLYTTFGMRWWSAFCDAVSKQGTVVIGPPEMDTAHADEFKTNAEKISQGASGVLPYQSTIIQPNNSRGPNMFDPWLRYLSEKLVLAGTGGKLTMLNDSVGIGGSQSDTHGDTFKAIANSDAQEISEIFQNQLDKPLIEENFPGQPVLAYFQLNFKENVDISGYIRDVVSLSTQGFIVDPTEVSQKTGYKITYKAPGAMPVMMAPGQEPTPGGENNPEGEPPSNEPDPEQLRIGIETEREHTDDDAIAEQIARDHLTEMPDYYSRLQKMEAGAIQNRGEGIAGALGISSTWLKPVSDLLLQITHKVEQNQMTKADLAVYLQSMAVRLPELFAKMDVNAFAQVLEKGMGRAVIQGVGDAVTGKAIKTPPPPTTPIHGQAGREAGAKVGRVGKLLNAIRSRWDISNRIVKRKDQWHVLSKDGSKHLGGPYKTKGEAVERLRQVEYFKAHQKE